MSEKKLYRVQLLHTVNLRVQLQFRVKMLSQSCHVKRNAITQSMIQQVRKLNLFCM